VLSTAVTVEVGINSISLSLPILDFPYVRLAVHLSRLLGAYRFSSLRDLRPLGALPMVVAISCSVVASMETP
jgi:hypothetical protein